MKNFKEEIPIEAGFFVKKRNVILLSFLVSSIFVASILATYFGKSCHNCQTNTSTASLTSATSMTTLTSKTSAIGDY